MDLNKLEHKNLDFIIKEIGDTGRFSGYANTWQEDLGGDTIKPGAFKKTIREHKGKIPILKGHDSSTEIGMTDLLREDDTGLYFEGHLYIDDSNPRNEVQAAREEYVRMKRRAELGVPMGISIGFTIPDGKSQYDSETGKRSITEVALWEQSTTPFPMNQPSRVAEVKDASFEARVLAVLSKHKDLLSSLPTPPAPVAVEKEADNIMSEPEFHSLMHRLGIPLN